MAEYICPERKVACGSDPQQWCAGCQCPAALEKIARDAQMLLYPPPPAKFSTAYHQDGYGVPAYTLDELLAYGAEVQKRLVAAFDVARDAVLNGRGPLEGEGLQSDQTNAVLYVLDDAFTGLV
jgi:hypothetical protein